MVWWLMDEPMVWPTAADEQVEDVEATEAEAVMK
jgi:hypothetical protein